MISTGSLADVLGRHDDRDAERCSQLATKPRVLGRFRSETVIEVCETCQSQVVRTFESVEHVRKGNRVSAA
jgi:cbb3-type cytochrome oxidase cytochrome c subunit